MFSGLVSIILAIGAIAIPGLALWQRIKANKGIGWQFIRFTVIASTLPIIGILALNGVLNGEAAALIGAAVGYAFGHASDRLVTKEQNTDT